ncbi:MAG: hypothetical protein MJ215_02465 [Spirochaetia bacterium]|nr:hypothetical protein [Spirochaetia bacterium]
MLTKKIFAVAGNPAGESYYPHLFRLFSGHDDHIYTRISASDVEEAFVTANLAGVSGLNMAYPFRISAMDFTDRREANAENICAVNTITFSADGKTGYNTEFTAIKKFILRRFGRDTGRAVIMGTSEDSVAVACGLTSLGWDVVILNRTLVEAVECAVKCGAQAGEYNSLEKYTSGAKILVFADTFRNFQEKFISCIGDIPVLFLNSQYSTNEIICNADLNIIPSDDFILEQAAASYSIFTGETVDDDTLYRARDFMHSAHCRKNIFSFIGFSGSGKTLYGRSLAERTGRRFVDLDEEIEKQYGKSIPEILEGDGYDAFSRLEERILENICAMQQETVVACGCDTVLSSVNRELLKKFTYPIWLVSNSEMLLKKRCLYDYRLEPGISMIDTINRLFEGRNENYAQVAELVIKSDSSNIEKISDRIFHEVNSRYFF